MKLFCPNKNDKNIAAEFQELVEALGGENKAYLVWNKTEGEGLGNHPGLTDSEEFKHLLKSYKTRKRAIRKAADHVLHPAPKKTSSISKVLESPQLKKTIEQLKQEHLEFTKSAIIDHYIVESREKYMKEQLDRYITASVDPSAVDIYAFNLGSRIDWDEKKLKEIIGEQQEKLAEVFGLKKLTRPDGSFIYISKDKSSDSRLRVSFVNSITGNEWTDEDGNTHKGFFDDKSNTNEAAWNAIVISIEKGDPTTFIHEMVHYYIRTFWDSKLVLDSLKQLAEEAANEGKSFKVLNRDLEESLVNRIVQGTMHDYDKQRNRNFILKFWDDLSNILYNVIGESINQNTEDKEDVFDLLQAAFSINQDLSNAHADVVWLLKYQRRVYDDMISSEDEIDEFEGSTFIKIKQTIEARIKSEKTRNIPNNRDLLNVEDFSLSINRRSISNKDDVTETVKDFLTLAAQDIDNAITVIEEIKLYNNLNDINAADLMHLKHDIISYYDKMLVEVVKEYANKSSNVSSRLKDILLNEQKNLINKISSLKSDFDEILVKYVDNQIDLYSEELVAIGDKDRFIANMKLWARNQIDDGNLMPFENSVGPAVNSISPVVRLVEYIVTAQNRATYTQALKVGKDLLDKYNKCASIGKKLMSVNFMKLFCELDDDGNPTGYFARKYNYGKLFKIRDKVTSDIAQKLGLDINEETGEIKFRNKDEYVKYTEEFYKEMSKYANFRYKKEYYILRAKILSPKAVKLEQQIQRQIDILINKSKDKDLGIPLIFNLTSYEQNRLKELNKEKENLRSPYIIQYNADGSISSITEKDEESLEIARQFMKWDDYRNGKIKYKSNFEKFNDVRKKLVNKYGEDSYQVKSFDYTYKTRRISEDFYDKLGGLNPSEELKELYKRRSIIKNSILNKKGFYQPNLKKLNNQAFSELKRIDKRIAELQKDNNKSNFKELALKEWVNEYDENGHMLNRSAFEYFQELEKASRMANGLSLFDESAYTYTDPNGRTNALSIFKYTNPKNPDYIITTLGGAFSELDLNSSLVNKDFNELEYEEMLPKHTDEFLNKNYEKIQNDKKLKGFYDEILKVMKESYSILPNYDPEKMKYVMPQMRDRDAKLLFRNRHLLTNLHASVADAFSITETDTRYNEDFATRPDGSVVETIPIRWVTRLEDPSIISTDILRSVSLFYEMALNYQNKQDINPLLQTILFQTQGGFLKQSSENTQSQQAERIKNYLQIYVHGRTKVGLFHSNKKMSKTERILSRVTDTVLAKAHSKLMSHNWRAVLKNFIDSFLTTTGEILAGKYISVKDALFANKIMAEEIKDAFTSVGKVSTKAKSVALMQLNGQSGSIGELFGQHNETWLRRVLSKHFAMGEYTFVDYTFRAFLTISTYHSIRLVINPNTGKEEFLTKDLAMYQYKAAGMSMDEGLKAWKDSKTTLWDAYEVDDKGMAVVKDNYKDQVYPYIESIGRRTNRLVNQVAGTIRERSGVINGILDSSGKAAGSQTIIGAAILQMRGWMVSQMWDNLKEGHDFAKYQQQWRLITNDDDEYYTTINTKRKTKKSNIDENKYVIVDEDPELEGQYNFETGLIETGQWRGLGSATRHAIRDFTLRMANAYKLIRRIEKSPYIKKLTRNERYKLRRLSTMAATFFLVSLCAYLFTVAAAKWPDPTWLKVLQASMVSVISERASQIPVLNVFSLLDIVNSIVISKTLIQDADKFADATVDAIEAIEDVYDPSESYEYKQDVKSGAYKGVQQWQRDALKVSSYFGFNVDNMFRSMSESGNDASINYYVHNVAPTKQALWMGELFGGWAEDLLDVDLEKEDKKRSKSEVEIGY